MYTNHSRCRFYWLKLVLTTTGLSRFIWYFRIHINWKVDTLIVLVIGFTLMQYICWFVCCVSLIGELFQSYRNVASFREKSKNADLWMTLMVEAMMVLYRTRVTSYTALTFASNVGRLTKKRSLPMLIKRLWSDAEPGSRIELFTTLLR